MSVWRTVKLRACKVPEPVSSALMRSARPTRRALPGPRIFSTTRLPSIAADRLPEPCSEASRVSDTLAASLHGSGDLSAAIAGKRVMLKMRGPGNARLEGRADRINAELTGSGTLAARRLTVRQSDITVRGPGSATVNRVRDGTGGRRDELVLVESSGRRQAD